MKYRIYLLNGMVTDRIDRSEAFTTPLEVGRDEVARALSVSVEEIEAIETDVDHSDEIAVTIPPASVRVLDLNAFKRAVFDALGVPACVALTAAGYLPLFTELVNARAWSDARGIVDFATQQDVLSAEQRTAILGLMTEHGVPEA